MSERSHATAEKCTNENRFETLAAESNVIKSGGATIKSALAAGCVIDRSAGERASERAKAKQAYLHANECISIQQVGKADRFFGLRILDLFFMPIFPDNFESIFREIWLSQIKSVLRRI